MLVRTWNLFHGNAHPPERRGFLREMVELVADGADVVCLQEVPVWALRELERWSGLGCAGALARAPRIPGRLGAWLTDLNRGLFRSAFEGEADAILARGELTDPRSAVVSTDGLRRIVHGARLGDVFVANFHTHGRDQLERALAFVAGEERLVLGGDANLTRFDVPGWLDGSIDQILVRGLPSTPPAAWPVERRVFEGRILSDHAPVELRVG